MITTQLESFEERLDELKVLLPLHWQELALNKDKVPLSPQYQIYIDAERAGKLIFMTLRQAGELVGYFIGFIGPGLHYQTCLECRMDIFYTRPDIRGKGLPGVKLFRALKQELKRRGVQRWYVGSKVYAPADLLFEFMKFEKVETYYSMWIGD